MSNIVCSSCGQLQTAENRQALYDVYDRIRDGRSPYEPLVYTQSDLAEANFYNDEEMHESVMLSMEKNMYERGLCPTCGYPDLRGVTEDMIMSEEDARN